MLSSEGKVTARAQAEHVQHHPKPGWVEHDIDEIWDQTRAVIEEVLAKLPRGGRVAAVGIANPGETVAAWRRSDSRPLGRALVWQDTRNQDRMDELARDPAIVRLVTAKTGLKLDAYFSVAKMRWILDHFPEAKALEAKHDLCVGTVDSWLIWKLTGGKNFLTDTSTAARTLLFDIHSLKYDPELLNIFGISPSVLPEVKESADHFGIVTGFGPTLDGVPILASLADQPASLFGMGCREPDRIKATFGTGCFVYLNSGTRAPESRNGLLSTIAWTRAGKTTYALDGGIFAAGSVVTWLRDHLGLLESETELDSLVGTVSDTGGVTCVPALAGLAAPYWSRGARASWLGMGLHTTKAHLVLSALEGIACRVTQVVRAMERDSGLKVPALWVDGGLTRSNSLMQAQADFLGIPVHVSDEADHTVAGACLLAGRQAGIWKSDEETPGQSNAARVFEPKWSSEERQKKLARFERAAELTRNWAVE